MVPHCRDVVLMAAGYKRGAQIDSGLCRQTQNNRKYKNRKRLLERVTQPVHPNAIDPLCSRRKIKHATYKTNLADFNQLINIWLEYECESVCVCVCEYDFHFFYNPSFLQSVIVNSFGGEPYSLRL